MKKRFLSFLTALALLTALLPTAALAATSFTPDDSAYWTNVSEEDGYAMLTSLPSSGYLVFVYYGDDCSRSEREVPKMAEFAADNGIQMYAYGSDGNDTISGVLFRLLNADRLSWPVVFVYNADTGKGGASTSTTCDSLPTLLSAYDLYSGGGSSPDSGNESGSGSGSGASIRLLYDDSISSSAWEVLRLTNQHRMSIGLDPLSTNDDLQMAANQRAYELTSLYQSDHSRPDGSDCFTVLSDYGISYRSAAENIASGYRSAEAVVNGWLNSSGHRKNIENSSLTHMGVGEDSNYWSQDFIGGSCSYSSLSLSRSSISGKVGQSLEDLLSDADITVTARCSQHGSCYLPLIAGMCSNYDANAAGEQTVRVSLDGAAATLTVTLASACTEHVYDSGKVTQAATCTAEGVMTYTCTICGATKTEVIPKTAHTYNSQGVCTICDASGGGSYSLSWSSSGFGSGVMSISTLAQDQTEDGRVKPGASVSVEFQPQEGSQLLTAYLCDASGSRVQTLIDNTSGLAVYADSCTFRMPEFDAVIEASYAAASSHAIRLSTRGDYASCGSASLLNVSDPSSVLPSNLYDYGVSVEADPGYVIDQVVIYDASGRLWMDLTDQLKGKALSSQDFYFYMPPMDVEILVTFKPGTAETPAQTGQPAGSSLPFRDVTGHWAAEGIAFAYEHDLFSGTSATTFEPDTAMNRAMVVTVLARYAGVDTSGSSPWYAAGQSWAMGRGISDGSNMTGLVTREQLATMLYRYLGSPAASGNLNQYPDASSVSGYAVDAMRWAVSSGLISGMDGKLNPQGSATRAQVATIMMRFCQL